MRKLKRALIILTSSIVLGACAPAATRVVPRKPNLHAIARTEKPAPEKQTSRKPVQKIVDGRTTYEMKGKKLLITIDGKTRPPIKLGKVFRETLMDPAKADMRMDNFPPKMKREGRLLYVYSPGAKGIVVISPETDEAQWIEVAKEIQALPVAPKGFDVKNGIIGIAGAGVVFIAIIGLGDLLKYETHHVLMRMDKPLSLTGKHYLLDPEVEIKGTRVYISDDALGKRYFYEVVNGIALPITVEAD